MKKLQDTDVILDKDLIVERVGHRAVGLVEAHASSWVNKKLATLYSKESFTTSYEFYRLTNNELWMISEKGQGLNEGWRILTGQK